MEQAKSLAANLQFQGAPLEEATKQIMNLYQLFLAVDATQVEINPFGETPDGRGAVRFEVLYLRIDLNFKNLFSVVCFDAKINFDDNAKFRQNEIFLQEDTMESDPREVEASKHNLNYIGMDGNIGCLGIDHD